MEVVCKKCSCEIDERTFCASKPNWCRPCYRDYMRAYREKNREKLRKQAYERWINNKEKILARAKKWRQENHADRLEYERSKAWETSTKRKEYMREYKEKNREKIRENQKRYRERNRQKVNAQAVLNYHVKVGNIEIPEMCSLCERKDQKLESHHDDYNKPLDVIWVCNRCHKKLHKIIKSRLIGV